MFGFKNVKREKFRSSFLRKVFIDIDFPQIHNIKLKSLEIKELFSEEFPRFNLGKDSGFQISINNNNTDFKHIEENDNVVLKSLDGQKEILLTCNNLKLIIEGSTYSSYEQTIQYLFYKFNDLFRILEINEISKSSIRKVNLIEFGYDDVNIPNGILNALLNKALVYNDDAFPDMGSINLNIHNVTFKENDYILNLKYGMNTLANLKKNIGQVIIDLDIISNVIIKTDDLPKEIALLNDELYNVFDWITNDNAKQILRK